MSRFDLSDAIAALVSAALMAMIGALGLASLAGAHPAWSGRVVFIGIPLGLLLAWTARRTGIGRLARLVGYLVMTVFFFGLAAFGKARFVASFAEDELAGTLWYFGWIATAAAATALLARLFSRN